MTRGAGRRQGPEEAPNGDASGRESPAPALLSPKLITLRHEQILSPELLVSSGISLVPSLALQMALSAHDEGDLSAPEGMHCPAVKGEMCPVCINRLLMESTTPWFVLRPPVLLDRWRS